MFKQRRVQAPINNLSFFLFSFLLGVCVGGGGGGLGLGTISFWSVQGEWTFVGVQRPEQNNVSVD